MIIYKSRRCTLNAWCANLNCIDVHGRQSGSMAMNPIFVCRGQSACDDKYLCSNSISSCFDTKNSIYSVVITMCLILECSCHNVPCFGAVTSPARAQVTSCLAVGLIVVLLHGCPLFHLKNTCKECLCSSVEHNILATEVLWSHVDARDCWPFHSWT